MKIGIGLPNHIAATPASLIVGWARRAQRRGFESVATVDRLVYPSVDTIVALALAAEAGSELTLVTDILLAPLYQPIVLAKQLGSIAGAAGDRLVLGIAVGAREDDYTAAGVDFRQRGRLLDKQITTMRQAWGASTPVCPAPAHIPLLFGGSSDATIRRATTVGDGWVAGGLRDYPAQGGFADRVRAAWSDAGRPGGPQLHASVSFAFGANEDLQSGRKHMADYYGFAPDYARLTVADLITTPEDARDTVRAYRDLGFDRLLFHPTVADENQVDRLSDAIL
jgi:alkanesulfonate monooxygenase SsuD/methylene tetrahydromethanopterin reductase-like flavin-dependent oxidoreductase (luciferase family)